MPTTYTDQFYYIDPANPPATGAALTPVQLAVLDSNNNGLIRAGDSSGFGGNRTYDSIGGSRVTAVWNGDQITVDVHGAPVTITGVTFYLANGQSVFTPGDGQHLDPATFDGSSYVTQDTQMPVGQLGPPCFTPGTLIATPQGDRAVETLQPGDLVLTQDHGPQMLRWIGQRQVIGRGDFAPVRIAAGALGNRRDLLVSPQHRMLVGGWRAQLFFGADEVLVAARHLVNDTTIRVQPRPQVTYIHLLFDRHEVIFAEGAATESFYPGETILAGDAALRSEIVSLFPELDPETEGGWDTARAVPRGGEARVLAC
ncbi:MAG: type I secretion protein [Rhodobacteraceae bacterium]|nr:type I secretion protein [Paracoccaceae bacterium]